MLRVAGAFGLSAVDVDIAFIAVTICCHRGMAATPITSTRSGWRSAGTSPSSGDGAVPADPAPDEEPQ
jgi:hypothetical protein